MKLKSFLLALVLAIVSPLLAQATTVSGVDSAGNLIQTGAGNYNTINSNLANFSVYGNRADSAGSYQFDFLMGSAAPKASIAIALVPNGQSAQFPGTKDLVIDVALNGSSIGSYILTNHSGVGTALYFSAQPQIWLNGINAMSGDVLSIVTSFSGFATSTSRFDVAVATTPLPAAGMLLFAGLGVLGVAARRKAAASPQKV